MITSLTKDQMTACLKAQQGEVDAVYMYERLAETVSSEADKNAFPGLPEMKVVTLLSFRNTREKI